VRRVSFLPAKWYDCRSHWNCHVETVVNDDHILLLPRIFKQVEHNLDRSVPNQLIVALIGGEISVDIPGVAEGALMSTSEKAGADILLNLFHSEPSDAMIFLPKNNIVSYSWIGLGKRDRERQIS
jgi:hypothetical protein